MFCVPPTSCRGEPDVRVHGECLCSSQPAAWLIFPAFSRNAPSSWKPEENGATCAHEVRLLTFSKKTYHATDDIWRIQPDQRNDHTMPSLQELPRNRRIVGLILWPPHDKRRVLQTSIRAVSRAQRRGKKAVRDAILQAYYALRESFLEDLDLDQRRTRC